MTREQATRTAEFFKGMKFSKVEVNEFGWNTGNWEVHLWCINPEAGNRNLEIVKDEVTTEKEAKLIAKKAKGKFSDRDREALHRIAVSKKMDRE